MYSDTITMFNRYRSRQGDMWYPHVLHNVNLIVDSASIIAKYGAESTGKASLHIQYHKDLDGNIMINEIVKDGEENVIKEIPFIAPKEWEKLLNDQLPAFITFKTDANKWDFFIKGEYPELQPINDKDFIEGFYAKMEAETECYVLTTASDPYKIIPHFEILAR